LGMSGPQFLREVSAWEQSTHMINFPVQVVEWALRNQWSRKYERLKTGTCRKKLVSKVLILISQTVCGTWVLASGIDAERINGLIYVESATTNLSNQLTNRTFQSER
jgi:hypothetical protein